MNNWTSGYVTDVEYTYGYFPELNPLRARLACLNAGLVAPPVFGSHCELGFGQGMSVNIHAAASASTWYANDFNPAQADFAQSVARAAGANAHLTDEAFSEFCVRADLPDFDSIGLHGVWSWITDENRAVIVDFVRRKLKVGGVLYISYNTQPGWASMVPIRDLIFEHNEVMGTSGRSITANLNDALVFAENLMASNPLYATANPNIKNWLSNLKGQNRNYLVHEYLNRHWCPMNFSMTAKLLFPAKLDYACSANFLENIDAINLTPTQQSFLKDIPDTIFRESVRDFMVNRQFRRDYWIKGGRKITTSEQAEALRAQKVILGQPRREVTLKVKGVLGEASMQGVIYNPILDALADHKTKTLGQIENAVKSNHISFTQLVQAIIALIGAGVLAAAQDDDVVDKAKKHTDKLNAHFIDRSRYSADGIFLASPITGGGVMVDRIQQFFLLSMTQGNKESSECAKTAWDILDAEGQRLVKDGRTLDTPEENLAELTSQATTFAEKQLPVLKALQIA